MLLSGGNTSLGLLPERVDRNEAPWLFPAGLYRTSAPGQRQHAQTEHQHTQGEMDRRDVCDAERDLDRGEYEEAMSVSLASQVGEVPMPSPRPIRSRRREAAALAADSEFGF
jgi:hypothetical protein